MERLEGAEDGKDRCLTRLSLHSRVALRTDIEVLPFLCVRARPDGPLIQACLEGVNLRAMFMFIYVDIYTFTR